MSSDEVKLKYNDEGDNNFSRRGVRFLGKMICSSKKF